MYITIDFIDDQNQVISGSAVARPVFVDAGIRGPQGPSAYQIAVDEGFEGTEEEWLASLNGTNGEDGSDGKSAYEIAVENGFAGTEAEWLESLHENDYYINVLDRGFDNTGVDSCDALMDDLLNEYPDRGATVFFPRGIYRFTAPIVLGNGTKILGAGGLMSNQVNGVGGGPATITYRPPTVIYFDNNTDGFITPNSADYNYRAHGIEISSLTIKGSGSATATRGIFFKKNVLNEAANLIYGKVGLSGVRNCYIEDWGTPVDFDSTADSCYVIDTHIHDCGSGIIGGDSETQIIRSCIWAITANYAVLLPGVRSTVSLCEIEPGISTDGIKITGETNKIVDNDIKSCATGVVLWGKRNLVNGNTFSNSIQNHAILVGRITGEYEAHFCTITGNIVSKFGVTQAGGYDAIKVFGYSDYCTIVGNTISSPGTYAASSPITPARAILLRTTSSHPTLNKAPQHCVIANNITSTDLSAPYLDEGNTSKWYGNLPIPFYQFDAADAMPLVSGKYLQRAFIRIPSNNAIANGDMHAVPVAFSSGGTLDRIAISVEVAGNAGAVIRLGIYKDSGNGQLPGELLIDAGTVNAAAIAVVGIDINVPVTRGVYWLVAVAQNVVATSPQVPCSLTLNPRIFSSSESNAAKGFDRSYLAASTTGALPANWPSAYTTGNRDPLIIVRAL